MMCNDTVAMNSHDNGDANIHNHHRCHQPEPILPTAALFELGHSQMDAAHIYVDKDM
jgi:hypothetical protein